MREHYNWGWYMGSRNCSYSVLVSVDQGLVQQWQPVRKREFDIAFGKTVRKGTRGTTCSECNDYPCEVLCFIYGDNIPRQKYCDEFKRRG